MTTGVIPIAIVGVGKIARDQHIPTIAASDRFELAAVVTRHHPVDGVPAFATIGAMMADCRHIRAVAVCTPPLGRLASVREALSHGLDVLIEKPPAATLSEAEAIVAAAQAGESVLFSAWHSRHAAAVEPARAWLAGWTIKSVAITWKEDVRVWHPGQDWIWEPGIGVFDPGINALSILTRIVPQALLVEHATQRFPSNRSAPIAADLRLTGDGSIPVNVAFDFDQRGEQTWDMVVETDAGVLCLKSGGNILTINGEAMHVPDIPEYASVYARFADLIDSRTSDADLAPFRLIADAFMLGTRETVAPFNWNA